jgi:hypothetical protein
MLFLPVLALAATCAQAPTGLEIAKALSARAARDAASTLHTTYRKEWREEDLDDQGNASQVTKTKAWHIEGNGNRFAQTVLYDSTGERIAGFREEKVSDARHMFVERYDFAVIPPCSLDGGGRRLWIVSFRPRTDVVLPEGDDEDLLLNRLEGTMYVEDGAWYVRQASAQLTKPFRLKIFGKVTAASVFLEQDDDDGVVIMRNISTTISAESRLWPFDKKYYHFRQIYQFLREPKETRPSISPQ